MYFFSRSICEKKLTASTATPYDRMNVDISRCPFSLLTDPSVVFLAAVGSQSVFLNTKNIPTKACEVLMM